MAFFTKRIPLKYRIQFWWEDHRDNLPWIKNEAEATVQVIEQAFAGYPQDSDFATKDDAVTLLQSIWNIVDNWDGSRINVKWAETGVTGDGTSVYEWARTEC